MADQRDCPGLDQALLQPVGGYFPPTGTSWLRAVNYILWGLVLTILPLPFFEHILPLASALLLCQGLRTLRTANVWFARAHKLAFFWAGWHTVLAFCNATPLGSVGEDLLIQLINRIVLLAFLVLLRSALRQFTTQSQKAQTQDPFRWLIIWYIAEQILLPILRDSLRSNLSTVHSYLMLIILAAFFLPFFFLIHRIWSTAMLLDKECYPIASTPTRFSALKFIALWLGCTALVVGLLLFCHFRFPTNLVPAANMGTTSTEIRTDLMALGFPTNVLDDLDAEELQRLQNAKAISATKVSGALGGEVTLTTVTVLLENDRVRVLNHFRWDTAPSLRGLEGIACRLAHTDVAESLCQDPTGRFLCTVDGQSWEMPFVTLEERPASQTNNGPYDCSQLYAEFSMPTEGEAFRGYTAYGFTLRYPSKSVYFNTIFEYARQTSPINYPLESPYTCLSTHKGSGAYQTLELWGESGFYIDKMK